MNLRHILAARPSSTPKKSDAWRRTVPGVEGLEERRLFAGGIDVLPIAPTYGESGSVMRAGPDGSLWVTAYRGTAGNPANLGSSSYEIDRVAPDGSISRFPIPDPQVPIDIAPATGGGVWFSGTGPGPDSDGADSDLNFIGRLSADGRITEYPIPTAGGVIGDAEEIAAGPDGNVWFTDVEHAAIGKMTPSGQVTEFALPSINRQDPSAPYPAGIAAGPDGDLWFTEDGTDGYGSNYVGRITTTGAISVYPTGNSFSPDTTSLDDIRVGPHNTLEVSGSTDPSTTNTLRVRTVTMNGVMSYDPALSHADKGDSGSEYAVAPDGSLWFAYAINLDRNSGVTSITPKGKATRYRISRYLPPANNVEVAVTATPDGDIYVDDLGLGLLRITPGRSAPRGPASLPAARHASATHAGR